MSAFFRLPIVATANLGTVPDQYVNLFENYERAAYEHWIFDRGSSDNLIGRVNNRLLTAQATEPNYSAGYLTLPRVNGQALLTDRSDTATAVETLFAVVRASADLGSSSMQIMGSLGATTGSGIFFHSVAFPKVLRVTARDGMFSNALAGEASNADQWVFVAMARNFSGATKTIKSLRGGGVIYNLSTATGYTPSAGNIALGNAYTAAAGAGSMDVAEFGIFTQALSDADLQSLYARRKRELGRLGISVL
jgi:hypothetical protein